MLNEIEPHKLLLPSAIRQEHKIAEYFDIDDREEEKKISRKKFQI